MSDITERLHYWRMECMGVRDADALMLEAEKEIERLRDESASWEEQASDRADDAVRFIKERDAALEQVKVLQAELKIALAAPELQRQFYERYMPQGDKT